MLSSSYAIWQCCDLEIALKPSFDQQHHQITRKAFLCIKAYWGIHNYIHMHVLPFLLDIMCSFFSSTLLWTAVVY